MCMALRLVRTPLDFTTLRAFLQQCATRHKHTSDKQEGVQGR
jgi:hypothetical protein